MERPVCFELGLKPAQKAELLAEGEAGVSRFLPLVAEAAADVTKPTALLRAFFEKGMMDDETITIVDD